MAVRDRRGARLGRAARSRQGFVALAAAFYGASGLLATWPALEHAGTRFLAESGAPYHEAAAGDHLQTGWNLWLFGHQLEHLHEPWLDPYSFRPELSPRVNFQGLVFGLPFWPLFALGGAVFAWNVFTLLTYAGAGGAACGWLRSLDLPRGAALAGGLAFALAPYRVAQTTGHLLGPIALFVPLSLLALEKRRPWLAAAAITAIPLSGQVSLALGAVPLFFAYAFVRGRGWLDAVPGTVLAVAAAELAQHLAVQGSVREKGRTLAEVGRYSADWTAFLSRHGQGETFVFLGWLTPGLALAGLVLLVRSRRYALAALLAAAVVVPIVVALGTHLPTYRLARDVVHQLRFSRVPERLLPIACLALAALAAFALARLGPRLVLIVLVLIAADLHVRLYHAARADESNAAYAALRHAPPGRLLELPVFLPDDQRGSIYLYYDLTAQRQRPGGYSTTAPLAADRTERRLRQLTCGVAWPVEVTRLRIRYVAFHRGLWHFAHCRRAKAEAQLRAHGFQPLASSAAITLWAR
jgi:hypothetical protein